LTEQKDFQLSQVRTTTRIKVNGLQLWGKHGVLEEEQVRPQKFEFSVVLTMPQVKEDNLDQTVDYRSVIEIIHTLNNRHFDLIETFAQTIAQTLFDTFSQVDEVVISVKKYPAFDTGIHLDHVCAEVHVQRVTGSKPTSA